MNSLLIESALVAAFASNFPGQTIYTGTSYSEITPESLNVIIAASDVEHVAGGLYKATVTVKVEGPALLGSSSKSSFSSALNAVRSSLEKSYLTANWPSDGPTFAGVWIQSTKTSQDTHEWVADVQAIVGVSE